MQERIEVLQMLHRTARTIRSNPLRPELAGAAAELEIELGAKLRELGATVSDARRGRRPSVPAASQPDSQPQAA